MSDPQNTVFISYRRSLSSFVARAIFSDLRANDYDVFMDVESIDSGTFDTIILNQIAARAHCVVICAPGSFEQCDTPEDWFRREIETAIGQGRNVVPVMVNGFKFEENAQYLTGGLADLSRLNALPLFHEYFDEGMARLRDRYLKQPVPGAVLPAPKADQPVVEQKIEQLAAQATPTNAELAAEANLILASTRAEDDLEGRIADYSQAIQLNPDYGWAYNNRGLARYHKGDLDGAITDFNQAIRFVPASSEIRTNRSAARLQLGDLEGAIADADQALYLNPLDAKAFCNRGEAHARQGDLATAVVDLTQALRLKPKDTTALINRGEVYIAQGQPSWALHDFKGALMQSPNLKSAQAGLAISQYETGDQTNALARWRALVDADRRYLDADWVGQKFNWRPELVDAARRLIAGLTSSGG